MYKALGQGSCRDTNGKESRHYYKVNAFSTISKCRDLCTALSAACVGYSFGVSAPYAGNCAVHGLMVPIPKLRDGWIFGAGNDGSDTLTGVAVNPHVECYAKQPPGASRIYFHFCS